MSIFDTFERKHDYLVCVDSDGCVMDTMNCSISIASVPVWLQSGTLKNGKRRFSNAGM